jgi:hypothetical protein
MNAEDARRAIEVCEVFWALPPEARDGFLTESGAGIQRSLHKLENC